MLILRPWIEVNHETGLRARITQTLDPAGAEDTVAVAANCDDICAVVKQWVDNFADLASRDGNGHVPTATTEGRR